LIGAELNLDVNMKVVGMDVTFNGVGLTSKLLVELELWSNNYT